MGIIEEIKDMDYDELVRLRSELDRIIYEKAIMRGYKDGFRDGQKSERDRKSLLDGKIDKESYDINDGWCDTCGYKNLDSEKCRGCAKYDGYDNLITLSHYKKESEE